MIRHSTIARQSYSWLDSDCSFFRAGRRGRLVKSRPAFSNAFGHGHRRVPNPQQQGGEGEPDETEDEPQEPGDGTPDDGEPQPAPDGEEDEDGEPTPGDDEDESEEPFDEDAEGENLGEDEPAEPEPVPVEFGLDDLPEKPFLLPGLIRDDSELIAREFQSFYDLVMCANNPSLRAWKTGYYSHKRDDTPDTDSSLGQSIAKRHSTAENYFGSRSFEEAVHLALTGWPEGRRRMHKAWASIPTRNEPHPIESYDVGGMYPIVPLYIAGDPACMMELQRTHIATRPVIRIDCDICKPYWVEPPTIIDHGIAILSFVAELEAQGYSTELRVSSYSRMTVGVPDLFISAVFKKAGEDLDLDRAAFALAHPSVLRRLKFAIQEQHAVLEEHWEREGGSYGWVNHQTIYNNSVFIPAPDNNMDTKTTRARVQRIADRFMQDQLKAA